jgi:hypothetical protein
VKAAPVLVRVLRDPECLRHLSLAEWDLLLRQARAAQLIGRIALLAQRHAPGAIAPQVAPHFEGALLVAQRHREAVEWEITQIRQALDSAGLPLILLKGAAYLAAGAPAANGRSFADIDILVPKARINEAEAALMMHGWATSHHSAYDDRYYREWMHELPPMQHGRRMTVVDVHHAILPVTASSKPDSARLIAAARALPDRPGVLVLAPVDIVIHSACHLFHEEELEKGLRDLSDLDLLLRDFAALPSFWSELLARASELDLERAVFYALRFSSRLLGTPVPVATLQAAERFAPAPPTMRLMDALYGRALLPHHPSCDDGLSALARRLLFLRAHWLRMPPALLARHLAHKTAVAIEGKE